MLCIFRKYKDLFGSPGKGVHSYKFLDVAVVDYVSTIMVASLTTYFSSIPLVLTTIVWFIVGIIMHILFGVNTNTLQYLGLTCN